MFGGGVMILTQGVGQFRNRSDLVGRLIRAGSFQLAWTDWIGLNRAREFLSVGRLSG